MSVYVSALKPISAGRITKYATMSADTETELDAMSARIVGLHEGQRFAATRQHAAYVTLTPEQRALALSHGAKTSRPRASRQRAYSPAEGVLL